MHQSSLYDIGFMSAQDACEHPAMGAIMAQVPTIVDIVDARIVNCPDCAVGGVVTPAIAAVRVDGGYLMLCANGCKIELDENNTQPYQDCVVCEGEGSYNGKKCDCLMFAPAVYMPNPDCVLCQGEGSVNISGTETACPAYCWRKE